MNAVCTPQISLRVLTRDLKKFNPVSLLSEEILSIVSSVSRDVEISLTTPRMPHGRPV
jgi:hypothetical protein